MLDSRTIICVALACVFAVSGTVFAQETDLSVVVIDSLDPAVPGMNVSFEVEMANAGPDDAFNDASNFPVIDIYLPMGVPVPFQEYLSADEAGRETIANDFFNENVMYDENIWDAIESSFFFGDSRNNFCQGLLLQASPVVLTAADSGKIYYDATLPEIGVAGFAYRNASGEMVYPEYVSSDCSDAFNNCGDGQGVPCLGARLTMYEASGAPMTLVDDGSFNGSEGCNTLVGFPIGNVALIDRGTCSFQDKFNNAHDAGASGVIVANEVGGGANGGGDNALVIMACTDHPACHELTIPIPGASVSYNSGLALKAALAGGEVAGFVGIRHEEPNYAVTEAILWEVGTDTDTNSGNDLDIEITSLSAIFIDGFESGDTLAWGGS